MLSPPTKPQIMIALKRYKSFARDLYGFEHLYEMEDIDFNIPLTYTILYAELPNSAIFPAV
jgi:hypothetical protein